MIKSKSVEEVLSEIVASGEGFCPGYPFKKRKSGNRLEIEFGSLLVATDFTYMIKNRFRLSKKEISKGLRGDDRKKVTIDLT